jgi:hypothetical protein
MEGIPPNIRSILSITPERWQRLAESLPNDLLERKPEPDAWSARECLSHILETEKLNTFRVRCFLEGKDFPAFNPDEEGSPATRTAQELARQFVFMRQETLALLDTLTVSDLDRGARHGGLGPVTLRQLLNNWAAHDLNHTVQAERAIMQPFIDDCGPWQVYYDDHWVKAKK